MLQAAGTKWNFLPFRPGLVGGHCIGVDPYYLTHKAQEIGYHPEMILAGRRINDNMAIYVAERVAQLMIRKRIHVKGSRILMMGLTFKENCPDLRNSKVADVVSELKKYGAKVDVYDPWIDAAECEHEYGIKPVRDAGQGPLRRGRARGRAQAVPRNGDRRDPQLRAPPARAVRHQVRVRCRGGRRTAIEAVSGWRLAVGAERTPWRVRPDGSRQAC